MTEVYIGMGGNVGDTQAIFKKVLECLAANISINEIAISSYYLTSPVSKVEQNFYLNAVCRFQTLLSIKELHAELQRIELLLGKVPKPKEHPRIIDLDLLFFGNKEYCDSDLIVPHPRWKERLFVLIPLADLTEKIVLSSASINILNLIDNFSNKHNERVKPHVVTS